LVFTLLLSMGTGIAVDYLFSVSGTAQLSVSGSVLIMVFVAYLVTHVGYGAIYVIIAIHPTSGRQVCAYVGLTTQRPFTDRYGVVHYPRIEQHLVGSDYYNTNAVPWADTVVLWYFAHESYHMPGVRKRPGQRGEAGPILRFLEYANIRMRRPLYNYQLNQTNGRHIPKWTAEEQRRQRDALRSI